MRFPRILCAVDFTASSREALALASDLARAGRALSICHVFERERVAADVGHIPDAARLIQDLRTAAELELESWRRGAAAVVPGIEAHALAGSAAWDVIADFAERTKATLVVVGAGARHGLLGSVAERVVRHAPCPVLVVAGAAPPLARIVCAVDFSAPSHAALVAAADLAAERHAELTLLHGFSSSAVGFLEAARQAVTEQLRAWVAEVKARGDVAVSSLIVDGPSPAAAVLDAARAGQHDLLVTGTRGRTGIARALLGSVAERIVRHADRAVLVVREDEPVT